MHNVVLIGFMGTGKTSTGRMLATKLGAAFFDLDQRIEEKYAMSIPEMFQQYGEAYFRQREREMVQEVAGRRNAVISTGGGTVIDPRNIELLRQGGILICLTADVEVILARTGNRGQRPVLDANDRGEEEGRREAIKKLLKERRKFYAVADYTVDTTDKSPLLVVDDIIRHLKARGRGR
ncbi:MAG: shikimate kinase [Selenomonadaceae bacterium]|nr:shikimate kinase [Selenomonadaceae bacterium]